MRRLWITAGCMVACTRTVADNPFGGSNPGADAGGETVSDVSGNDDADAGPAGTSGDGTEEGTGDGAKFDVGGRDGGLPDCEDPPACGCDAVDLLFVIDSSTSMRSYQLALASAAPGFTDAIFGALPQGIDLHVGVTTTSFYTGGAGSPGEVNCQSAGTVEEFLEYYDTPDGGNNGENGGQGRLRVHEGQAFFATDTSGDPLPLKNWLTGNIRAVGESGSVFEMPAAGAGWAFHPANAGDNAGFVRDAGAVLVLFLLTDEVGNSPEDPLVYHDMVTAAKTECGGDACVVTGGVMKPCMATVGGNTEYEFLASFGEQPVIGDIGPDLDDCYEDCESGDIEVCPDNGLSCDDQEMWTAGYTEALGGTLAQIIADTCASIAPAG